MPMQRALEWLAARPSFSIVQIGAHVGDMVTNELPTATAASPDIVTVWTGANDLIGGANPDSFAAQLTTLL